MIPILYDSVSEGIVPSHYGIGALTDCLSCTVTEERNGAYEIYLEYAVNGNHADDLAIGKVIKAKPNFTDGPQLFRIYKVGKNMNGRIPVYGQHISYDLGGKLITSSEYDYKTCQQACIFLDNNYGGGFTINSDIVSSAWVDWIPSSVRSVFGGKEGSLLDLYGGEWKYDNFTCSLLASRGSDRGVTIPYGKNLTELSQEIDMSSMVTAILPYAINPDTNIAAKGTKVSTGLSLPVEHEVAIDFSNKVNWEDVANITSQIDAACTTYLSRNRSSLVNPKNSITLSFVQLGTLAERIELCDTVKIYYEALGINVSMKCVKTEWDVLAERYKSSTFGDSVTSIADTIQTQETKLGNTPTRSEVTTTAKRQSDLITGNLGGYIILHDSDSDGYPDELLVMNTNDISTATKVWRFNQSGLGYSSTGYSGTYDTIALTMDGQIDASSITTGTLNADLIKAGTISDAQGHSEIDLTNGEAKMLNLKAISAFDLIEEDETVYASLGHSNPRMAYLNLKNYARFEGSTTGSYVTLKNMDDTGAAYLESLPGGAGLYLRDLNNKTGVSLYCDTNGGNFYLRNTSGVQRVHIFVGGNGDGAFDLRDSSNNETIALTGQTGVVTCVSVNQTSTRKEKKNIKPISDSEKILELQAVSFDFKDKSKGNDKRGFIAEDVAEILPNLVAPDCATLDYIGMIPYLQDVIKRQEERIKTLEEKINNLGG